jgi:hypothetical protein
LIADEKTVGYSIHIRSLATLAGKEIEPLEIVGVGTEFKFDVSLSTVNKVIYIFSPLTISITSAFTPNEYLFFFFY